MYKHFLKNKTAYFARVFHFNQNYFYEKNWNFIWTGTIFSGCIY